jgi:Cu-Zn family superoxide dismutase
MKTLPLAAMIVALAAPAAAQQAAPTPIVPAINPASNASPGTASVRLVGAGGDPAGTATLTAMPLGVLVEIDAMGLPPDAWVAMHIHERGACDPAGGHESAGGHFNPSGVSHGFAVEGGPHAGDLPNIHTDAAGAAKAQAFNTLIVLDEGENAVRGRALIIHAGPDDYASQPSGGAGDRLACGVID